MSLIRTGLTICGLSLCLLSCDKLTLSAPTLAGTYEGEATIYIEETRWNSNFGETLVLVDTTLPETITVTRIEGNDSTYLIERETEFFYSTYTFEGERTIPANGEWIIGFTYDKDWLTEVKFSPEVDSFTAYMHMYDVFESIWDDSEVDTLMYYYLRRVEYQTHAMR